MTIPRIIAPLYWILLLTAPLTGASLQVSHQAREVAQGEAVLLIVQSSVPMEKISARIFEKEFPLFSLDDQVKWQGIIGIDLACKPGRYEIEVSGWGKGSTRPSATTTYPLEVQGKEFAERRLKVESKYVSPPAEQMKRINREAARTRELFAQYTPEKLWEGNFLKPVPGGITSPFGRKNFVNDQPRSPHSGVDLRGAVGVPVKAPASGKIIMSQELYFAGNTVMIDHGFGMISYLCHLSEIKVEEGNSVDRGEIVGLVGSTGRVTGPHLHWTIKVMEQRIDPMSVLEIDF